MHSVLASSALRDPATDAGSPSEDSGLLSVIPLDVRDPWGPCWPRLALVGPHLTSLRGLMNPPGSFSRESVRKPSNYEKVDSRMSLRMSLRKPALHGTTSAWLRVVSK
jgi:hypothetical protein